MELLTKMNREEVTMMLVSHDPLAASYCSRVVFTKDGELYNEIYAGDGRKIFYQKITAFSILFILVSFFISKTVKISDS